MRFFSILILSVFLFNCSNQKMTSSHFGMIAGSTSATLTCIQLLNTNQYLTAACAVTGAYIGANSFFKSDKLTHTATFVDHLNNAPIGQSYATWYNQRTGNHGDIKISRSYVKKGAKCSDYTSTISVTNPWPMNNLERSTEFGIACQLPDGRWQVIESVS